MTASKTQRKKTAPRDPWMTVNKAAQVAGCAPQTVYRDVLGNGRRGKDYRYVGGFLFVHERAVNAVRVRLEAARATAEGAA